MRSLRRHQPYTFHVLDRYYVVAHPVVPVDQDRLDAALRALNDLMPERQRLRSGQRRREPGPSETR